MEIEVRFVMIMHGVVCFDVRVVVDIYVLASLPPDLAPKPAKRPKRLVQSTLRLTKKSSHVRSRFTTLRRDSSPKASALSRGAAPEPRRDSMSDFEYHDRVEIIRRGLRKRSC